MKDFAVTLSVRNNHLKERREARGLTQMELSLVVGIAQPTYGGYETMRLSPLVTAHSCRFETCPRGASMARGLLCKEHDRDENRNLPKKMKWGKHALTLAEFWECEPGDLFPDAVLKIKKNTVEFKMDETQVQALGAALALHAPELLPQPAEQPDERIMLSETSNVLGDMLETLSPREQLVMERCFGLNGKETETLDEIAARIDVTRERARQIRETATSSF